MSLTRIEDDPKYGPMLYMDIDGGRKAEFSLMTIMAATQAYAKDDLADSIEFYLRVGEDAYTMTLSQVKALVDTFLMIMDEVLLGDKNVK